MPLSAEQPERLTCYKCGIDMYRIDRRVLIPASVGGKQAYCHHQADRRRDTVKRRVVDEYLEEAREG